VVLGVEEVVAVVEGGLSGRKDRLDRMRLIGREWQPDWQVVYKGDKRHLDDFEYWSLQQLQCSSDRKLNCQIVSDVMEEGTH